MAALADNATLNRLTAITTGTFPSAVTDRFYNGALVELDLATGEVAPLGVQTNAVFVGICNQEKDATAAAANQISCYIGGDIIVGSGNGTDSQGGVAVAGVTGQTDVGKIVYCTTDNIADATLTRASTDARPIGRVYRYKSSGYAQVKLFSAFEAIEFQLSGAGREIMSLGYFPCTSLANGDILTGMPLQGTGKIVDFYAIVKEATTDADAAATINLELGTTNLTGGVITIDDTAGSTAIDTMGAKIDATTITAGNVFHHGDTLSVEAASVTAYSGGAVELFIVIERGI